MQRINVGYMYGEQLRRSKNFIDMDLLENGLYPEEMNVLALVDIAQQSGIECD